jgi:Fis family transcriptional regulator
MSEALVVDQPSVVNHSTDVNYSQDAVTLREKVTAIMDRYFANLDGEDPSAVYNMVMEEIEAPLFEAVMKYTNQNQSRAAIVMGLARGTLRTKLKKYGLLNDGSPRKKRRGDKKETKTEA